MVVIAILDTTVEGRYIHIVEEKSQKVGHDVFNALLATKSRTVLNSRFDRS